MMYLYFTDTPHKYCNITEVYLQDVLFKAHTFYLHNNTTWLTWSTKQKKEITQHKPNLTLIHGAKPRILTYLPSAPKSNLEKHAKTEF